VQIISVTRFVFPRPCRNPSSVDVFSGDLKKPVGIERNARDPRDNEGIALVRDRTHAWERLCCSVTSVHVITDHILPFKCVLRSAISLSKRLQRRELANYVVN